jgi:hypothetical protein
MLDIQIKEIIAYMEKLLNITSCWALELLPDSRQYIR